MPLARGKQHASNCESSPESGSLIKRQKLLVAASLFDVQF